MADRNSRFKLAAYAWNTATLQADIERAVDQQRMVRVLTFVRGLASHGFDLRR